MPTYTDVQKCVTMGGLSTTELLCLYLDRRREQTEAGETGDEIANSIGDAVPESVSQVLTRLREDGLVTDSPNLTGQSADDRTRYQLTESGREHASTLRAELADRTVQLRRGGHECSCKLGAIEAEVARDEDPPGDDPLVQALLAVEDDELVLAEPRPVEKLVGRDHELAVLEELLYPDESRQETHTGILISGMTGIGKTVLARALANRVRDRGGVVLTAAARPGRNEPYGPIKDALSTAANAETADPFEEIGDVRVDADSYEAYRQTLFAEITTQIETLVGDEPAVLFVDDLQWADRATLELLASLLSNLDADRTAIVGTYEESLVDKDDRLAEIVERECDAGRLERLQLSPLKQAEIAMLVEQTLGVRPPDAFVASIEAFTGGNPLFATECLRHLLDEGALDPASDTWPTECATMALPETVEGIVESRLAGLSDEALSILQSAAAIGERVPLSVLAAATDKPETTLRETASTFVAADLWTEAQAIDLPLTRTFRFESTIARKQVLETLSPAARQSRHESVAEALLSVDGQSAGDRHAAVAGQYERAGRNSAAIAHYRAAAEHATEIYAHDCAIDSLNRAYDLASEDDREQLCHELRLETATRWHLIGEYDRAASQVEAVYYGTTDEALLQRALTRLGKIAVAQGAFERAIKLAAEGINQASEAVSTTVCQLLHVKCMAEWRQGNFEAARETATEQRQLAERIDESALLADATHDLGTICLQQGAYDEAETWYQHALEHRRDLDDEHGVAKTLGNMGIVAQHQGDLEVTYECYERSLEAFRAVGSQYDVATVLNNLGTIALEGGDLDRAEEYIEESLTCFRRLDIRDGIALVVTNRGGLARAREEMEAARTAHREGLELARELGSRHLVAENIDGLGLLAAMDGEIHDAREYFERSLEIKRDLGVSHGIAQTLSDLASVCQEMEADSRAREHLEEAEELAVDVNDPSLLATCRGQLGIIAIGDDESHRATRWVSKAVDALEGAGTIGTDRARPIECLEELITLAIEAGYDDTAGEWYRQVSDLLEGREDLDEDCFDDQRVRSLG